ncbi:MAG: YbhB/YbcL family Raf kinase inhibitor-like protein [Candidatus Methanomethylophilaceae archaeon]
MKVTSAGIVDGFLLDKYGVKGNMFVNGMPGLSMPFEIEDAPEGTKSFAVVFDDYDAIPVSGFCWIHWIACDLKKTSVKEGESHNSPDFTEGCNSWHGIADRLTREQAVGYGGPAPPNCTHRYTLKVYALDTELGLERGFFLNDLYFAMQGHILAHAETVGKYSPKE